MTGSALAQSFSEEAQKQLAREREQAVKQAQQIAAQRPKLIMPGQLPPEPPKPPARRFQFD